MTHEEENIMLRLQVEELLEVLRSVRGHLTDVDDLMARVRKSNEEMAKASL